MSDIDELADESRAWHAPCIDSCSFALLLADRKDQQMTRLLSALAAAVLMIGLASAAGAATINAGDFIKVSDGVGSGPGGEFNIDVSPYGTPFEAITFCIERTEFLAFGEQLLVNTISTNAIAGGLLGGSPDPLDVRTAYLFAQFSLGTLSGYTYGQAASANALQDAIWFLEQEFPVTTLSTSLSAQAQGFLTLAASANPTWLQGVSVLNIRRDAGGGNYTTLGQDLLYYDPTIPEPGAVGVFSMGLLVAGGLIRRFRKAS